MVLRNVIFRVFDDIQLEFANNPNVVFDLLLELFKTFFD